MKCHICIEKEIDTELSNRLAISERLENIPFPGATQMSLLANKKWTPGRQLRVGFLDDAPTSVKQYIISTSKKWNNYANIPLIYGVGTVFECEIRIGFDKKAGSWSYVGTDALGIDKNKPTINFGWLEEGTSPTEYNRVILHEFGHALGCIHEHQHPQSGIPWNLQAVYAKYSKPPNSWTKEEIDSQVLFKYSVSVSNFSAYDKTSIMSYAVPKELTIGGFEVPWNTDLSETDKTFINSIYPYDKLSFPEKVLKLILRREPNSIDISNYNTNVMFYGKPKAIERTLLSEESIQIITNEWSNILKCNPISIGINEESGVAKLLTALGKSEQESLNTIQSSQFRKDFIKRIYKFYLQKEPTYIELNTLAIQPLNFTQLRVLLLSSQTLNQV